MSGFGGLNMTGFSVLGLGQPAFSSLAVTPVAVTVPAVIHNCVLITYCNNSVL